MDRSIENNRLGPPQRSFSHTDLLESPPQSHVFEKGADIRALRRRGAVQQFGANRIAGLNGAATTRTAGAGGNAGDRIAGTATARGERE